MKKPSDSTNSTANKKGGGTKGTTIADKLDQDISKYGPEDVHTARTRLFLFFREAKKRGWIVGLDPRRADKDPMLDEMTSTVQSMVAPGKFSVMRFTEFCQANPESFSLNLGFVRPLIEAIRSTRKFKTTPQLRALYRDVFGPEAGYLPHMLNRLLRQQGGQLTTKANCKIFGDYLLFRPDSAGDIRPAFFRFYEHETLCIRSMGLRLDPGHGRLSSKGWVIKQQQGYLISGYIVDRSQSNGKVIMDGGFSNLWVDDNVGGTIYQEFEGSICLSTALHFQAPFSHKPSCARGVLIRVTGLENQGGLYSQEKSNRNIATYKLQSMLMDRFGEAISITECASYLESISQLPRSFFEEVFTAQEMIEAHYESGFSEGVNPVAPLEPISELNKPHTFNLIEDIHVDGRIPLLQSEGDF